MPDLSAMFEGFSKTLADQAEQARNTWEAAAKDWSERLEAQARAQTQGRGEAATGAPGGSGSVVGGTGVRDFARRFEALEAAVAAIRQDIAAIRRALEKRS
jgi:hypothetical protein